MAIENLPITSAFYDVQRFTQFGSQDVANWYQVAGLASKKEIALYPTMGRKHVRFLDINRLVFAIEPREVFKSVDFFYVFVGIEIYQFDRFYNQVVLTNPAYDRLTGDIWFDFLSVGSSTFVMFTANTSAGRKIFVIEENTSAPAIVEITDSNAPDNPTYVAAFGNRFTVSVGNSPQFYLSVIGLDGNAFNPATSFTINGAPVFASASGKIQQMGVLHNQLFIFCNFVTDIWANIPSQIFDEVFPWKLNTSSNFDYGMADPHSLSIDFGMMAWLATNQNGLTTFMISTGQQPQAISTQAINVLLEGTSGDDGLSPFLESTAVGFFYQWENSVFYRVAAKTRFELGALDVDTANNCIEFNFDTKTWHRCIELDGNRNRIQKHVFFNNKHLVTVERDTAMYEMRGDLYYNELRNTAQSNAQATDAFLKYPMRYELITRQIYDPDYSEFITDYIEIDFVFGDHTFFKNNAPFANTIYIVDETSTDESPVYLITEDSTVGNETFIVAEDGNTPSFDDNHYYALFKPHVEIYYSDDGGVSFHTADLREFSPLGNYRWRMRWYQLGPSRNRCYKLICVSSAPIVILGAVQNRRRASGGGN